MPGEFARYAKEAFRQMDEAVSHPTSEEIGGYVQGALSEDRSAGMAAHLAQCSACRERAAEFRLFLADCENPVPATNPTQDDEYRELQRRLRPHKVVTMPRHWLAIAAGLVVALGLAGAGYRMLVPSTPRLLAEAYRERRSSEFRIAGADWAEVRQQRAGTFAFSLPEALLKAQARLGGQDVDDSALLRLRGEAQMIANDATEAVRTLERARDLKADDPGILGDLGAAYALRGDAAHQFGDYSAALDCLERSLRLRPGNNEAMFNRAVVLEKLMLYDQAEIDWKAYLKADSASAWAKEARARLAAIEEKMRKREKALGQIRDDPEYFLTLADAGDVDAEAWLISPTTMLWLQRSASDSAAKNAVVKLAGILAAKHGDTWLQEVTSGTCARAESIAALGDLRTADGRANAGDYDGALAAEEHVGRTLLRASCVPGSLQARLSQVVAMHNALRTEACLAAAQSLNADLERHQYIRLRARVAREYGVCAASLGRLDEASAVLRRARVLSRGAGYAATDLGLWNLDLDMTTSSGLPSRVQAGAEEAVRIFWGGSYSGGLIYPTLSKLRQKAAESGQPGAALRFARSAVWSTSGPDKLPIWRVGSLGNLAAVEEELGEWDAARADLESSDRYAEKLSAGYRLTPTVALARLDLEQGRADAALAQLKTLGTAADRMSWVDQANYYTALGEALARKGSRNEAIAAFRKPIDASAGYFASVKSEDERSGVRKVIENAYRGLVAAQLAVAGSEDAAFRTWQAYRNLDAPPGFDPARKSDETVLWFLGLSDGFVAWFSRGDEISFHRFEAPKVTVSAIAARFLRECSDPQRSSDTLHSDALALYRWMVEPFNGRIGKADQSLIFELDGALAGLPVEALIDRDGHYLGERFSVLVAAGRSGAAHHAFPAAGAKVLVVVNPAIAGASAARFPPLPDSLREAEAIRASFAQSVVLEGRDASVDSLKRQISNADIVHFAGHGYSDSGYGGLLFAPQDPSSADYQLLRAGEIRGMDWSRCSLAVLSACAAAEGETHGAHNPESLIGAIAKAGVPRVAASLWNVDSTAAAQLMAQFYAALNNGEGAAEALRAAQSAVRRNPRWQHPYYWAGFQLYGTT